jgi:gliding motility-associated lipoprotein GldD
MRYFVTLFFIVGLVLFVSCSDNTLPKPQSFMYLEYPEAEYHQFVNDCPYSFVISKESSIEFKGNCDAVISYSKLDAQVHISYKKVQNNLHEILTDVDKLTSKHTVKADAIIPYPYENKTKRVYGLLNEVQGASASNVQFYVTDSLNHMLTASLYFKARPNYDSLFPAIDYIKNDMMKMMETVEWKKNP